MNETQYDIAVIGGGPAGSTAGLYLSRLGFHVCVIEKKEFPRETLCGEFLSREVMRIIADLELGKEFKLLNPNPITSFKYCTENSRSFSAMLPFTGYGLKRGTFDSFLLHHARKCGADIYQPATVEQIQKTGKNYDLFLSASTGKEHITARYVLGAYGKTNALDKTLHRVFRNGRSGLNGVKFHVPRKNLPEVPDHVIQIYAGRNMYCGVNVVNDDTVTLCFLEERAPSDVRPRARIGELMKVNPHFSRLVSPDFESIIASYPIYGTGDIYFGKKDLIENGVFMIGDAARVIAPLAGDGLGMAMESAKILSLILEEGRKNSLTDDELSMMYTNRWRSSFKWRLRIAGNMQQLLLSWIGKKVSGIALSGFPFLLSQTIKYTRGSSDGLITDE